MGSETDAAGRDPDAQSRWMESASVGDSVDLSLDNVEDSDGEEQAAERAEEEEDGAEEEEDNDNATAAATDDAGFDQHSLAPASLAAAPVSVQAPPFAAVHRSWAAFDAQLKGYSHSTYQLYVVRTTTSVQRRNTRIAELAATTSGAGAGASSSNADTDDGAADAEGDEDEDEDEEEPAPAPRTSDHAERLLIPAHLKWYSKTMMCTHGWKDRNRGTGKRATTMVRSTGCPVKMCITVQHTNEARADDDEDDDGWRVIVTKHMRTHNHPLSKELYLFYTENRRIYDPELLALVGGNSPSGAALSADFYGAFGDDDEDHALSGASAHGQDDPLSSSIAAMAPKAFNSWEQFHECLGDYSLSTQQHFRIRSTISTQAKNAKTLEQGTKAGKSAEEVSELLVPEPLKWYSKLLICNHGWKRKSRSKMARFQRQSVVEEWNDPSPNACPAMVMARLQRDIHDKWRIVINRQVTIHNHALYTLDSADANHEVQVVDGTASELEASSAAVALMNPALTAPQSETTEDEHNEEFVNAAVRHLNELQLPPPSEASTEQDVSQRALLQSATADTFEPPTQSATELHSIPRPMTVVTEVVVRVAKLQTIHQSWEAFHSCLQQYSESTYQSYRTRTTSSVAGRNQKIMEMRATNENSSGAVSVAAGGGSVERDGVGSETRLIPEHYKWYSKTLTCTHGWKERRRGSGKRTIHIVRSTLCPVKICATIQYLEPDSSNSGEVGWRVVVTKHIIDHNHNLSKELFQHYRDNRRIYDPALLAISQANAVDATSTGSASSQPLAAPLPPASTNQVSDNVGPASITDEQHALLASGAAVSFEQEQAFNAHHTLPESAYAVPNPVNPNQQVFLMANGTTLVSFTTIPAPTSTHLHSATAPTLSASTSAAMHQMFGSGSMFPNPPYSSMQAPDFSGEVAQGLSTTSIMCQVHGHSTSLEASGSASGECTCLRIPVAHQFTPSATVPPSGDDSTSRSAKRRGRSAEDQEANMASASKRPRTQREDDVGDPHNRLNEFSSGFVAGAAPTVVEGVDTSSTASPAPVWSPENPAQVEPMTESDGTVIWRAPRLKRRHENWAEFTDHLNAYSQSTLQLYRVRTTSSIAARNTRIYQQLQQMQEDGGPGVHPDQGELVPHLVPASYEWYSKTYVCTHGWKERRRGKGQRVSHSLRSTECPVKLCVTLQRDPHDTENWNVVVTKQVLNHNHEISISVFQGYSENRRIKDPQLLAQAEQMWREGQPRRKVFEFLKGATKTNIVMKDIHNLVQRWQQQQPQQQETSTVTNATAPVVDALGHGQQAHGSSSGAQSELDLMI